MLCFPQCCSVSCVLILYLDDLTKLSGSVSVRSVCESPGSHIPNDENGVLSPADADDVVLFLSNENDLRKNIS